MRTCIAIMAMLVVVPARAAQKPQEREFKSEAGGFSIVFPAEPKAQKQTQKAPDDSDVQVATYRVASEGMLYVVITSDFSEKYLKNSVEAILDNARDAAVTRGKGKLIRETKIKLKNHPGRDIVVDLGTGNGVLRFRAYLVGGRQYSIILAGKTERLVTSEAAERFFDSFKLVK